MISKIPQSKLIKDIASMLIIFLGSAFVILNLFYYGRNDDLANFINTVFNPPLAFITTMLALILLHQVLPSFRSRALWLGLVLGWGCWAVAESLWAIAFLKGDEVLFPSWADLFWTVGYIPIIIALFIRSRSMAGEPSRMNRFVITVLSVLILGFTFFGILLPIIRAYDASAALEGGYDPGVPGFAHPVDLRTGQVRSFLVLDSSRIHRLLFFGPVLFLCDGARPVLPQRASQSPLGFYRGCPLHLELPVLYRRSGSLMAGQTIAGAGRQTPGQSPHRQDAQLISGFSGKEFCLFS